MKSSELYKLIHDLYLKHGGFPPIWLISKESGITSESIEKCLDYFVANKKIIYKNNLYWFPEQIKEETLKINSLPLMIICKVIMGIIGVSCIICSIRFTYSFNKLNMPALWGFILSSAIAIFTSFCFTIREYLKRDNKKFQANLFIVLYILGVSYSIFTAIAGQYNDYIQENKFINEIKIQESVSDKKIELLNNQKERLIVQLDNYEHQLKSNQNIIDDLSQSPEKKFEFRYTWNQSNQMTEECSKNISELQSKINEIDNELIQEIEISKHDTQNIFDWISRIFGISSELLQFIISLFPAIFIDIISPLAISFAFNGKNIKK